MAWNEATALARINKLKGEAPDFNVLRFEDYYRLYQEDMAMRAAQKLPSTPPLFSLPRGKAIVVDTVQIYIAITNYDEFRLEEGHETEASHERAMRLLHLYYSAADRAIETSAAQRVDFHNGRVHAVVLEPGKHGVTRDTLAQAFAFIDDFQRVADAANRELARSEFSAEFRIGIDVGTCVAINNGTGCEQEPMFLGSAANHSAKLAFGKEPGVYVSDKVRALLKLQEFGIINEFVALSQTDIVTNAARQDASGRMVFGVQDRQGYTQDVVAGWKEEIRRGEFPDFTDPSFSFSYREPPLSKIDYAELSPSRSIRMPLVSMYADLSGYTDYIDRAVASGAIREAVRALHVIRSEFQNVVEKDFGGRKVRFIGDCIHALLAEGSRIETDERMSVSTAAQCAGGLHSSFDLCKFVLGNLESLGLAIGMELGQTPISRIGIRGDRSVRVASSVATTRSEQMQRECDDNGVKLGPRALRVAPVALEDLLDKDGYAASLDYDDVAVCLSVAPAAVASPNYARAHVPSQVPQPRAHFKPK
ncbi:hypothetical protein SAMN05421688_1503 [Poseidonocella pacifica]|uniref:Guanylate cyclase domain-containing protein n=1 Tax=Poseidonocella pacifica TaxID=871651 RepID=A0A1I0WLM3_9RHOB|nr:hypothetical protein [Poseidonocella pacifica]SFA88913.1 hypothetical protein SAMN05421688_1503 [Poseidonocella pacifica]